MIGAQLTSYCQAQGWQALEGVVETAIKDVYFYRSAQGNPRQPFVYQSSIVILGQGHKTLYFGDHAVAYGPDNYLVVGMPVPLECEAFASEDKPLLGLGINIDPQRLRRIVSQLDATGYRHPNTDSPTCVRSVGMETPLTAVCLRIIAALSNPQDAAILGDALVDELLYRVLTGHEGPVLFELARQEGTYARVAKALTKVHAEYHDTLTVQGLADEANMSVSAFHHAFRSVTMESPLQYIKKVRLTKAKELIQLEGLRVNDAARQVGYTSPSQFSREYRRHFNETPRGKR
uniref:AraC family transcriptional regulator n=1 Tax=Thaumasiovibrio occultus TaxID=1891184 RepID=UPI000B36019D|nr:AraC family transcriptional regulator N-terminal domain-containing protein [Thaumasiovibrio occultus]